MTKDKKIVKSLTLREISGVTIPAQSGALVTIIKSADAPMIEEITKYLSTQDGAKSFDAFLAEDAECKLKWKAQEQVWPLLTAFNESVTSIAADLTLSDDERQAKIAESVAQFVVAMQSPQIDDTDIDIEKLYHAVIQKDADNMSDELKKAADDLKVEVAALTKKLAEAETLAKLSDADKAYLAKADKDSADKFKAASEDERKKMVEKAASEDEVFKSYTGVEIHKSSVGAGVFQLLKSQDDDIRKSREDIAKAHEATRTVELTKVAETDYAKLPGTAIEKVAVLKKMDAMSEGERATLTAMLKAANDALEPAFIEKGTASGQEDIAKSAKIETLAKAYQEANPGTSIEIAKVAVMRANPGLYE